MTRFKELRRIEEAITHRDALALRWAAEYCGMRMKLARTKPQVEHWRKLLERVATAASPSVRD